jgi:hypothetical protein
VEAPITDWLREAYDQSELLSAKKKTVKKTAARKSVAKKRATRR